jgi:hypothetical protein
MRRIYSRRKNVKFTPPVDPGKVILTILHVKFGLMKNFVKALNNDGEAFKCLGGKFPKISEAKLTEGIFSKLPTDTDFDIRLNELASHAWASFKAVTTGFLGNKKHPKL